MGCTLGSKRPILRDSARALPQDEALPSGAISIHPKDNLLKLYIWKMQAEARRAPGFVGAAGKKRFRNAGKEGDGAARPREFLKTPLIAGWMSSVGREQISRSGRAASA